MGRAFEYRRAAKQKRWDKMSKVFPKLSKAITIAAKDGSDPDKNSKLRVAIENAKAENMPKENIKAAIQRAVAKDSSKIEEISYEGKGPYGSLIFIETATDNHTRTVANIRNYLNKSGGQLLDNGSLEFIFSKKALFEIPKDIDIDIDELELELIDAGLEELEVDETIKIYADFKSFGSLNSTLDDMGIDILKSTLIRVPNSYISLDQEQMLDIENLIDKIEDDDDVLAVYTNIE